MWKSPQKPQHGLTLSMRIELQFTSNKSLRGDNSHKSEETICLSLSLPFLIYGCQLLFVLEINIQNFIKWKRIYSYATQASRYSFKRNFLTSAA